MKTITLTVSPDGEVVIEANGYKGKACSLATKALEQAMGLPGKSTKKPEWHQVEGVTQKVG
jgi:hypothetical protein